MGNLSASLVWVPLPCSFEKLCGIGDAQTKSQHVLTSLERVAVGLLGHPTLERHKRGGVQGVHARLGDPKVFVLAAELDRVWVVTGLLVANDAHLKTVFVDGGVFSTPAHTKTSVHLFEHAQHGAVHPRELGGEDDALACVPPQIDVAGGQGIGVHLVKRWSAKTEAAIHHAYWGKPGWLELMALSCLVNATEFMLSEGMDFEKAVNGCERSVSGHIDLRSACPKAAVAS